MIDTRDNEYSGRRWLQSVILAGVVTLLLFSTSVLAQTLTAEEQDWIAQKNTVRVRVINWPPYMIIKKNVPPQGIAIDYLKLIAQRTGINFKYEVTTQPFAEFLESIKKYQDPDLTPVIVKTPEREEYLSFTESYFESPLVIFARDKTAFVWDMTELSDKTVSVSRGSYVHSQLVEKYPEINLALFDSAELALAALATGRVDAYLGNLIVASHIIHARGFGDVRVVAPTTFGSSVLSMANRKDWPKLTSIINKAIRSITEEEKIAILNKYVALRYDAQGGSFEQMIKYTILVVAVALGIALTFIAWNLSLRKNVAQRTVALHKEIFEHKQDRDALSKSEAKYRSLVDNSLVGVFNTSLDGRFLFVNDAIVQLYDFDSPEQMLAAGSLPRWVDPKRREQLLAELQVRGNVENFEAETITRTGRHVHVIFSAKLQGEIIAGMVMDITQRKRAEMLQEESEANLVNAQAVAHIGSWYLDLGKNSLVWSDECYRIFDAPKEMPMTYEKFLEIVHPEDRDYVRKKWSAALQGDPYDIEHRLLIGNEVKWVREKADLTFDDKGNPTHGTGITQDITERKQADQKVLTYQQRLKALYSQLTFAEERERRRIAMGLHDHVSQTLALACMQLAAAGKSVDDAALKEQFSELSKVLLTAAQDTRHLIFELSSSTMTELGLGAAISELIDKKFKQYRDLDIKLINKLKRGSLDQDQGLVLFRSVRELLTNIVKHAKANKVSMLLEQEGNEIRVVVKDNGIGFAPEQEKLNVTAEGGLGLFSIEESMSDLGGSMEIDSRPYHGTTIVMTMPCKTT